MKQCALSGCHQPALGDPQARGFCILHAPWDGKDLSAFQAAIEEIIEQAQAGSGVCDFSHCYFPSNYDCRNLREAFKFHCDFREAKFFGDADFGQVEFFRGAIFWKAEFVREAKFEFVKFSGRASFRETKFRSVSFQGAKFLESVYFVEAKFSENAVFIKAEFSGDANFVGAEFARRAYFEGAEFRQRAYFSKVQTAKDAIVNFQWVRLLKPQQVFFHHVDLSRWSFLDTDLRRIDFNEVTWGTIRRLWSRRTALFDEIRVSDEKVEKDYLAKVERLYRHLKQNYESQRDYGRAGDFYYGEMEMKRRQLRWWGQIPFWLYRILSGYGESYPRALFWLIVMWLVFAMLFTIVGYTDEWGNRADLWRSLIYSAQSMTLLREPKITFDNVYGQAVELVASVLGVIQIALFGLALQRRFKR